MKLPNELQKFLQFSVNPIQCQMAVNAKEPSSELSMTSTKIGHPRRNQWRTSTPPHDSFTPLLSHPGGQCFSRKKGSQFALAAIKREFATHSPPFPFSLSPSVAASEVYSGSKISPSLPSTTTPFAAHIIIAMRMNATVK